MNKTQLYIEGQEIELNDSVTFALTKQFEDILNPTTIINDWSKTVNIPFTVKNNKIFGDIYKEDRLIISSTGDNIGIKFDPYKKLDFRLEWNGNVIMNGYAKLNTITRNGGSSTYNVTLNGLLGKLFQEMKKITFDKASTDTNYIIDGSAYFHPTINKNLIKKLWQNEMVVDYGFAPNNSFDNDFQYDSFQNGNMAAEEFTDVLEGEDEAFKTKTGIPASTVIPNGLLPRDIGEFRSYLQHPYIRFKKLFNIFKDKAEAVTGYTFELSDKWFNLNNPYWDKTVFMLKKLAPTIGTEDTVKNNITISNVKRERWANNSIAVGPEMIDKPLVFAQYTGGSFVREKCEFYIKADDMDNKYFAYDKNTGYFSCKCSGDELVRINNNLVFQFIVKNPGTHNFTGSVFSSLQAASFTYSVIAYDGTVLSTSSTMLEGADGHLALNDATNIINVSTAMPSGYNGWDNLKIEGNTFINANEIKKRDSLGRFKIRVNIDYFANNQGLIYQPGMGTLSNADLEGTLRESTVNFVVISGRNRSGSSFTINTLWNNDYNPFEQILNYCKMYRIGIFADDVNKKIKFIPLSEYFKEYTIEDWSDKVDYSQDYIIKPITFDNKYVLFNYDDSKTTIGKDYKEKYGFNYGERNLDTNYNFDNNTNKLFTGLKTSISNTDNVLSWNNLEEKNIVYGVPNEIYPYSKDDSKKCVDMFGQYYFLNGLKAFNTEAALNLRSVVISDDTPYQLYIDKYFYSLSTNRISVTKYPLLDILKTINGQPIVCLFNTPQENYTYQSNRYDNTWGIYKVFWENYINERYNIQNKLVTCYIRLRPSDYQNFEFNKFITINNQLYMVNKIYDYDVTSNNPTKVDLITIQDIKGYTIDNYPHIYADTDLDNGIPGNIGSFYFRVYGEINEDDAPTINITYDPGVWGALDYDYGDWDWCEFDDGTKYWRIPISYEHFDDDPGDIGKYCYITTTISSGYSYKLPIIISGN